MARTFPIKLRRCTVGYLEGGGVFTPIVTVHHKDGKYPGLDETFMLPFALKTKEKAIALLLKALARGWGERKYWIKRVRGYDKERITTIVEALKEEQKG